MGGTLTVRLRVKGKSRPQTDASGSESCSGKHNPKVEGSNPSPAIQVKGIRFYSLIPFAFHFIYRVCFQRFNSAAQRKPNLGPLLSGRAHTRVVVMANSFGSPK